LLFADSYFTVLQICKVVPRKKYVSQILQWIGTLKLFNSLNRSLSMFFKELKRRGYHHDVSTKERKTQKNTNILSGGEEISYSWIFTFGAEGVWKKPL